LLQFFHYEVRSVSKELVAITGTEVKSEDKEIVDHRTSNGICQKQAAAFR